MLPSLEYNFRRVPTRHELCKKFWSHLPKQLGKCIFHWHNAKWGSCCNCAAVQEKKKNSRTFTIYKRSRYTFKYEPFFDGGGRIIYGICVRSTAACIVEHYFMLQNNLSYISVISVHSSVYLCTSHARLYRDMTQKKSRHIAHRGRRDFIDLKAIACEVTVKYRYVVSILEMVTFCGILLMHETFASHELEAVL